MGGGEGTRNAHGTCRVDLESETFMFLTVGGRSLFRARCYNEADVVPSL